MLRMKIRILLHKIFQLIVGLQKRSLCTIHCSQVACYGPPTFQKLSNQIIFSVKKLAQRGVDEYCHNGFESNLNWYYSSIWIILKKKNLKTLTYLIKTQNAYTEIGKLLQKLFQPIVNVFTFSKLVKLCGKEPSRLQYSKGQ